MTMIVTGSAGCIGANFVLGWLVSSDEPIINLDKLTYAATLETQTSLQRDAHKLDRELSWKPTEKFETGIRKTLEWYLANLDGVAHLQSGAYHELLSKLNSA